MLVLLQWKLEMNLLILMNLFAFWASEVVGNAIYAFTNGGICIVDVPELLKTVKLINDRQCAIGCSTEVLCRVFMTVKSNATCRLYQSMNSSRLQSVTYESNEGCRIGHVDETPTTTTSTSTSTSTSTTSTATTTTTMPPPPPGNIVHYSSTTWTVPAGVTSITGLCIGAGGNGGSGSSGGGGSGYINYDTVSVTPSTNIFITIATAGSAGASSIGSYIVANGGSTTGNAFGGAGGSGGGGGGCCWGGWSNSGGSGGSNGYDANSIGGTGQGTTYWASAFAAINLPSVVLSSGQGGAGHTNSDGTAAAGGGGAGGILINGSGPQAGSGSTPNLGGGGGVGYGAGGGSGGCYANICQGGTSGAAGVCIIKWG